VKGIRIFEPGQKVIIQDVYVLMDQPDVDAQIQD